MIKKHKIKKLFCITLMVCFLFSTFGLGSSAYSYANSPSEDASEMISINDFQFSAKMQVGTQPVVPLELKTENGAEGQTHILYIPKLLSGSAIEINTSNTKYESFTVTYTSYQKSSTGELKTVSAQNGKATIPRGWCLATKGLLSETITLQVNGVTLSVKPRLYASINQLEVIDANDNYMFFNEEQNITKDSAGNFYCIPIAYSNSESYYEVIAAAGSQIYIRSVPNPGQTFVLGADYKLVDGETELQTVERGFYKYYAYTVGNEDKTLNINVGEKGNIKAKTYPLKIHSIPKDYFPSLSCAVKQGDHSIELGEGIILNKVRQYEISLKQDAPASITVENRNANITDVTYQWEHVLNYLPQPMSESMTSNNTVKIDTQKVATSGGRYTVTAATKADGRTYTKTIHFKYELTDVTHIDAPTIKTQPISASYRIGQSAKALSITAEKLAGRLTYQWYKNTVNNTETGNAIEGATQRQYTPEISADGTTYYYCKIKATYKNTIESEETVSDIAAITVTSNSFPWGGKGTEAEPYLLENTESITQLRDYVNKGISMENICFKMTQDISLPKNWTPIGCTADGTTDIKKGANLWAFSGTIDGDNKTLTVPKGEKPLLGYVKGAAVKNLVIYGEEINGYGLVNNFEGVGLEGSAIIVDNVTLKSGTKTLKSGILGAIPTTNGFAGVSAGFTAIIRNCTVEEGVVIGYDGKQTKIGSIAGRMQGVIENCTSKATVQGINDVGGIVGARDNALGTCTVKNCKFSGVVEASGDNAGGIAGGVYSNSTAPNGVKMTIQACTVDGKIQGMKNVGGILGAELYVAQAWDAYAFIGNFFSGTIQGKQNIGGIIGYYNSLNKIDHIAANFYTKNCGASEGIGMVKYVDTSYKTPTKVKETIYFNTEKGTATVPKVEGCHWRARYNRADDPLGADKEKLTKAVDSMPQEAICYELILKEGSVKSDYYLGDSFDFGDAKFTAMWTDGKETEVDTKDITIDGYDKNKHSIQTVTLSYGYGQLSVQVAVKQKESGNPKKDTLTVSFTLLGDSKHGENKQTHTLSGGGLQTWMSGSYEVRINSTVWDLMQQVQKNANGKVKFLARDSQYGTYVYGVTYDGITLSEFDNGNLSGWMYTLNGKHPEVGVAAQFLNDKDAVVFHYTDDYTKEEGSEKWNTPGADEVKDVTTSGSSGSATTKAPTEVKVSGSTATATIKAENQSEILKQAVDKKSTEIILAVSKADSKGAENVQLTLDTAFVKNISEKTNADLTVNTENGKVTLDQETMKTVLAEAKGATITLEVSKVAKPTEAQKQAAGTNGHLLKLTIKSGDKVISDFNKGKVKVVAEIVSKLLDKKVAAIHIADDGKIEQLAGKVLTIGGKKYYEFTTPHFSTFALVDADELGLEVAEEPQVDAKALTAKLTPIARSAKTAKKNVKVTVSLDKQDKAIVQELKDAGYTVKYRFYRSTKKAAGYKAAVTKKTASYTNTGGKKGMKYFYKVQVRVYDENGTLIAKTALKQCKYASRIWTK